MCAHSYTRVPGWAPSQRHSAGPKPDHPRRADRPCLPLEGPLPAPPHPPQHRNRTRREAREHAPGGGSPGSQGFKSWRRPSPLPALRTASPKRGSPTLGPWHQSRPDRDRAAEQEVGLDGMRLNYPETTPLTLFCGEILFHETGTWCQKDWGLLS
ncbi:hypothetical protein HJG60_008816 [Phyllostomus discolor]|uniref:Uncharacterized protein n=1 Tax=Phyllostomus discolor TaxID=89673 RepID=A0A834DJ63_9CHIR|nr:hypothetical protein HJG60_008816 [Phyllostomus discolor]